LRIPLAIMAVWAVIFIVPVLVYGLSSAITGLQPPGESPWMFLLGVAISKFGTAVAFVLTYALAQDPLRGQWLAYVGLWFVMFAIGEVGQAIGPDYSGQEAILGVISEAIYFPASGLIVSLMIQRQSAG
jgi:hypothetical protein